MERYITDERTGLKYELVGDYYFIAGDDEPEEHPIGIWGQRHLRYLKKYRRTVYFELLTSGKLNGYLAELNEQAEEMFSRFVEELTEDIAYVGRVEHSRRFWLNTRVAQIGQSRRRNWTVPSSRLYIDTNQVIAYAQIAFTRCGG